MFLEIVYGMMKMMVSNRVELYMICFLKILERGVKIIGFGCYNIRIYIVKLRYYNVVDLLILKLIMNIEMGISVVLWLILKDF